MGGNEDGDGDGGGASRLGGRLADALESAAPELGLEYAGGGSSWVFFSFCGDSGAEGG